MTGVRSGARRILETLRDSGSLWTASLLLDRIVPLGVLGWWPDTVVSPDALAKQVDAILRAWGMAPAHAAITVDH